MIRDVLRVIIDRLSTPSGGRDWYEWAVMALAHFCLGLFAATFLPLVWAAPVSGAFAIVAAYALKEWGDLRRRGDVWDSILDLGMVVLGVSYLSWPIDAVMGAVLVLAVGVFIRIARAL